MISAIFDDHYEAFPTWRENGLRGLTCIHVDAHLDVMSDGFSKESLQHIAEAKTREQLDVFRSNPRLPWGGFHCGNYLYPALIDGTVEELIWVLPPHIVGGETFVDGVRQECQSWLDLKLEEYAALKASDGAVVGNLEGCRFVVCTADKLPRLTARQKQNLVLDIDVDYFVRNSDDKIWQTPHELYRLLGCPKPIALTIAYSVDGGYTPIQDRYLGQVVLQIFANGDAEVWEEQTQQLLRIDEFPLERKVQALESFLEQAPECFKPAVLVRLGRHAEAVHLDTDYQERVQNLIARELGKKNYQAGLDRFTELSQESAETTYLSAYLNLGKGDLVEAKRNLTQLLEYPELVALERSRVLFMKASVCLDLGEAKQCLKLSDEAAEVQVEDSQIEYLKARAYKMSGQTKKAARAIRKALRLAKGRVSSLVMMLDAARIYDELGQQALAKSTRRELRQADVTGRYAIKTMLDESKL